MEDGGPSVTARRVAAHRLGFARVATDYGDPAADEALSADVAAGQVVPANRMHDYLAARTSFFDRTVVGAIDRGVQQVVVGAAGYDGRAFRYAKPGVRWFEVDHPATQRDKLERLERLGITSPHVRFAEADFTRDPVAGRLRAAGLDTGAPSLFLLEGVAVYLEPAVLETVLDQFRQVAAPGSRLAISVSLSRPDEGGAEDGARARFQAAVAALGEPARSTFEAPEAEALLARTGWRIVSGPGEDQQAAVRRDRLRSAGLLLASAGPRASARPRRSIQPGPAAPQQGSPHLPALLSQALVAFTIEFDNEAEHRLPHRTTSYGASGHGDGDPTTWLVSLAMWENCMRHVTDEPITVGELQTRARTGTNLDGMRRWGYITIDGTARKIHKGRPGPGAVLRATAPGLRARQIWLPLPGLIEQRWRECFGADQIGRLRDSLIAVVRRLDPGLPDCLPILSAALLSQGPDPALPPRPGGADPAALPLPGEPGSGCPSPGASTRSASTTSWPARSSNAGRSASPPPRPPSGPRWNRWPSRPAASRRPCSRESSRTRTTGAPRSAAPPPCRTTRWSCTAAATPTAANPASGLTRTQHVVTRPQQCGATVFHPP